MRSFKLLFLITFLFFSQISFSQIIYSEPAIPTADEAVTIYFNAEGTGLEDYSGEVYAHTGLTIDNSNWQYVIGDWGVNETQPQLERLEANLYKWEITPSIRAYYEANTSDNITEICIVFRSADGSQQTSPDIFYPVYELGLNVSLVSPDMNPLFVDGGEVIEVVAEATLSNNITLFVDNVLIETFTGNTLETSIIAAQEENTKHWIKVVATDGTDEVADSNYYYVRGETTIAALPNGVEVGINYIDESTVTLVLFAPYKSSIFVFGDFSNWEISEAYKMSRVNSDLQYPYNKYWVTIEGLTPGEEYAYQYLIDEELVVADPYCDKVLDPWNDGWISNATYPNLKDYPEGKTDGIVSVIQSGQAAYDWQIEDFDAPDQENLVIYECLIRDFFSDHSYKSLADTIMYFKNLGVTAIELMPIAEFEGNESWGYNPSFYFAPDKYYGPKNNLKEFIDVAHQNGIAVIMDMVLNHAYNSCPLVQMYFDPNAGDWGQPSSENPWFNETSPNPDYTWGQDFNHESQATKDFIDKVNLYWISEYKIDGFRFDFTKGFTNTPGSGGGYDQSRINILERMADEIWEYNPNTYVILEHFTDNSEEKVLANYGMMVWGNHNYNYNEATMGYHEEGGNYGKSDFSWISYQKRGFNNPHVVGYMESHDEERLMFKNIAYGNSEGGYDIQQPNIAVQRIELAANFFIPIPGPKMIWQFGELGYDYSINYCPDGTLNEDCRVSNKPIRWDYFDEFKRKHLYDVFASLNKLKIEYEVFQTNDYNLDVERETKTIHLNHNTMNVAILGNFDVIQKNINPQFQHTGWWYEFYTSDSINVTNGSAELTFEPGEYRLYSDVRFEEPEINGIKENPLKQSFKLNIFPNPASDILNLEISSAQLQYLEIDLINTQGNNTYEVFSGVVIEGNKLISAHLDEFNKGVYVIRASNGKNTLTKKLVVL